VPYPPDGQSYRRLAQAVLLAAVRDADLWEISNRVGADVDPTPSRQVFMARRFLTTEEECGGWCMLAGFDPGLFTLRMQAKLES
jgi:hypothetical protein